MFDESGTDYRARPAPKRPPTTETPADNNIPHTETAPTEAQNTNTVSLELPERRPLWLRVTAYLVGFLIVSRICNVAIDDWVTITLQYVTAFFLAIILIGLLGMRRWGAYMFMIYCAWTVISSVVVGAWRIIILNDVIDGSVAQSQLLFGELFYMFWGVVLYGVLGVWFAAQRKRFTPGGFNRYGATPYLVLAGVLLLFSAAQITEADVYLETRWDAIQSSPDISRRINDFFF